jgi:tRNA(fMet)-specific endonuclease VapC
MTYLLDTNTCIRYLNGTCVSVRAQLSRLKEEDVALCSVVKAELYYGVLKSARAKENMERLRRFTARFVSLPFDDAAAERYGEIRQELERQGNLIGPNDLMIASVALAHDMELVTHNTDEFLRVPGLRVVDWETEPR